MLRNQKKGEPPTAALPKISLSTLKEKTDTGVYKPGADQVNNFL
jgi:hypothetical protein